MRFFKKAAYLANGVKIDTMCVKRVQKGITMNSLYQERILDYYRNPRNRGTLQDANFSSGMANPSCGDAIAIQGKFKGDRLKECVFEGKGCVISQAVASMLCEKVIGMTSSEIEALDADYMQTLLGMPLGPTRLKCALLPLETLKKGLHEIVD